MRALTVRPVWARAAAGRVARTFACWVGAAIAGAASASAQPAGSQRADAGRFIAIDRTMQPRRIELLGIYGGSVRFLDDQQIERERPLSDVIAFTPEWWSEGVPASQPAAPWPARPSPRPSPAAAKESPGKSDGDTIVGVVELVDGQRLPGWPAATEPDSGKPGTAGKGNDVLAWSHPRFGRLRIPLDDVRSISLSTAAEAGMDSANAAAIARSARRDMPADIDNMAPGDLPSASVGWGALSPSATAPVREPLAVGAVAETDDQVTLRNGDRIRGLVEEIGAKVVISGKGSGGGAAQSRTETTIDRVKEIRMSNRSRQPTGIYAWLDGGTIVRLEKIESATDGPAADSLAGALSKNLSATGRGLWRIGETSAVLLDAGAARPLVSLPLKVQEAASGRRRFEPAAAVGDRSTPLWARDIQVRGAMTLEWELPSGAGIISGVLEMPEPAWTWGDCQVTLSLVGGRDGGATALASERLNASHPRAPLSVMLPAGATGGQRLRVSIEEGENGSIQDWVDLKRMMVGVAAK